MQRDKDCCRTLPAFACGPIAGCMAGGMLTSAAGGALPRVRAVSPARAGHSGYRRTVADLPLAGATLFLQLPVGRFFCRHAPCPRRIVAERFPPLVPVRGRHSLGVYSALRHVGLMVGGRAGARLTRALGIPGSFRTIVRLIPDAPFPPLQVPRGLGLDEWAWRKGRRCGTMLCDLARHQVVELLPERTAPSGAQWLQAPPRVESGCRDRSGLDAAGIRQGAPPAIQVVERFHLRQKLRDALARRCLRYRRDLTTLEASGNRLAALTPTLATISQARHPRGVQRSPQMQRWSAHQGGLPPSRGRSRAVARPCIGLSPCPSHPSGHGRGPAAGPGSRPSPRPCDGGGMPAVGTPNSSGGSSGRRAISRRGGRWRGTVGQRRRETGARFKFRQATPAPLSAEDHDERRPSPWTALRAARVFLATAEDRCSTDQALLAHRLRLDPVMPRTDHQVQTFCRMVRQPHSEGFDAGITEGQQNGVKALRAFVKGLLKDAAAVRAGVSLSWSNGPTAGCVHRLKLLKRQAYGRAGVDFLRHRILPPCAGVAA